MQCFQREPSLRIVPALPGQLDSSDLSFRNHPSVSPTRGLSTTDERNSFAFSSLQISHKAIFVLRKINGRAWNFAMDDAFFDLANEKPKLVSIEATQAIALEMVQLSKRHRMLDSRTLRHRFQVRISRGRRGIANSAAAVDAIVKDINEQVLGLQIAECREVEQREKNAAVRIQHDHFS